VDVGLDTFCAFDGAGVGYGDGEREGCAVGEGGGGDRGGAVGEGCVGEAVAEGEERGDVGAVVVSVADVKTFSVEDFEVLAGPVVVGWVVFETFGEGGLRC
jgi:hypothetical protein